MIVIGITGSIGSGKSTAAHYASLRWRCPVFDADRYVSRLLLPQQPGFTLAARYFPEAVRQHDLDKRKLAHSMFFNAQRKRHYEHGMHALVRTGISQFVSKQRRTGASVAILDVPLLFETSLHKICSQTWVVLVPTWIRYRRVHKRSGINAALWRKIDSAQLAQPKKKRLADIVIRNTHSRSFLRQQIYSLSLG